MGETPETCFVPVRRSLVSLLGDTYITHVHAARSFLNGQASHGPEQAADLEVDFYPLVMQERLATLLPRVGHQVLEEPLRSTPTGTSSTAFTAATRTASAPLSALGYYRVGEDGRLYLTAKSEHYHASLGHAFPGYRLIDQARALAIPNATHNNTRGYITRRLEEELIRSANGLSRDDQHGWAEVMARTDDLYTINRVLNLETGSLAVEAALKMILARFYRMQPDQSAPVYAGKTPVILVMGNDDGEPQANYHGTTVLTQILRGLWPAIQTRLEAGGIWKVAPIRPNRLEDLDRAFAEHEKGPYKIAGFFHEIIMMNYGGRRLTREFLRHAYELCRAHDVPTVADEIQSCMWAPHLFLFREYGLRPSCVAIGKGFPGGEYPASRILFSAALDHMPQFGALVTNGQEELAALAYLITMEWAQTNAAVTAALGDAFERQLHALAAEFPRKIKAVDGWRHMSTLYFSDLKGAVDFAHELNRRGLDISAQTYKADCPPVVLTKLPLIADHAVIDFVVQAMRETLRGLS